MKEQLYAIPVNDAFDKDCECPICELFRSLEINAIDFTMGPSYMDDDVRLETDQIGFCENHVKQMYQNQNRLGLSLMLLTHMNQIIKDVEKISAGGRVSSGGLFKKREEISPMKSYTAKLEKSCYVCNRINRMFTRYIVTVFFLYRTDSNFKEKFKKSKGFCIKHYALLYEEAPEQLKAKELEEFTLNLNSLFLDNMKRVRDDLEWFTDKFDYRYANEPWRNSKDALPRAIKKINNFDI